MMWYKCEEIERELATMRAGDFRVQTHTDGVMVAIGGSHGPSAIMLTPEQANQLCEALHVCAAQADGETVGMA